MLDKQAIQRRFERAADAYDTFSVVQRAMADGLVEGIEREPLSILELGCGTGYLTALLRRRFPEATIEAVDFAPSMIARARERVPSVRFVVADIEAPRARQGMGRVGQGRLHRGQLLLLARAVAPGRGRSLGPAVQP